MWHSVDITLASIYFLLIFFGCMSFFTLYATTAGFAVKQYADNAVGRELYKLDLVYATAAHDKFMATPKRQATVGMVLKVASLCFFYWMDMPYFASVFLVGAFTWIITWHMGRDLAFHLRNRFREIPINFKE